jgi:hypothetical protein
VEVAVLIQPVDGAGFRASTGEPLPAAAEGATRAEAIDKLRGLLEARVGTGAELVRLRIAGPRAVPAAPVWPDDALTRDWLAGITEVRRAADQTPEPWANSPGPGEP